ncbi:unnamed protein product [[Candida] boidinii]|nr:unnamed protein product [[Candida] boidinii]
MTNDLVADMNLEVEVIKDFFHLVGYHLGYPCQGCLETAMMNSVVEIDMEYYLDSEIDSMLDLSIHQRSNFSNL